MLRECELECGSIQHNKFARFKSLASAFDVSFFNHLDVIVSQVNNPNTLTLGGNARLPLQALTLSFTCLCAGQFVKIRQGLFTYTILGHQLSKFSGIEVFDRSLLEWSWTRCAWNDAKAFECV